MARVKSVIAFGSICILSGCAGLDFGDAGLSYYEPAPYLFVAVTKECVSSATVVSLPGVKRAVKFGRGYGSADLSVALDNGMLKSAGQKTDTKVPETITSFAALGTAMAAMSVEKGAKQLVCVPSAVLYPVKNGVPDLSSPYQFLVDNKVIDLGGGGK